jgi:hypothetical protein
MTRIRLAGPTLIAVLALGATVASSATAEESGNPTILPSMFPITFTAKNTAGSKPEVQTTGKNNIVCGTSIAKGEFVSQRLGKVKITFAECTANGNKCSEIELEGKVHLVDVLPTATLDLGLWIELKSVGEKEDVKVKCGLLTIVLLGAFIGVFDNIKGELLKDLEKGKEFIVLWKNEEVGGKPVIGEQQIKTCDLTKEFCFEKEVAKKFLLTAEFKKGTEELAALVMDFVITFTKEVEFHF